MLDALRDWLASPGTAALLERYVLAHERQAAALQRLAELKEMELGVDPPTLNAAAAPVPDDTVSVSNPEVDRRVALEMQSIAEVLERSLGRLPTPDEVLDEHDRLRENGLPLPGGARG